MDRIVSSYIGEWFIVCLNVSSYLLERKFVICLVRFVGVKRMMCVLI